MQFQVHKFRKFQTKYQNEGMLQALSYNNNDAVVFRNNYFVYFPPTICIHRMQSKRDIRLQWYPLNWTKIKRMKWLLM